jgi:hypothetical protein
MITPTTEIIVHGSVVHCSGDNDVTHNGNVGEDAVPGLATIPIATNVGGRRAPMGERVRCPVQTTSSRHAQQGGQR